MVLGCYGLHYHCWRDATYQRGILTVKSVLQVMVRFEHTVCSVLFYFRRFLSQTGAAGYWGYI